MARNSFPTVLGVGVIGGLLAASVVRAHQAHSLQNRVVVVTGGSRGLGLLIAKEFAKRGSRVALLARDEEELRRAEEEVRQISSEVMIVPADITIREEAELAIDQVKRHLGDIDVLVNNAGTIVVGPLETMTIDDYRDSLETHFWAAYFMTSAVLPGMRARGRGNIVNISSIGGKVAVPHLSPYCVGKFAMTGYSEGLHAELKKDGICVTTVCPGLMRTGSPPNAQFKGKHESEYAWFSVSATLPGISMSAQRAARAVVKACAQGRARLILSLPARAAVYFDTLLPGVSTAALSTVARLLPTSEGGSTRAKTGKQAAVTSDSGWLQKLNQDLPEKNNEML